MKTRPTSPEQLRRLFKIRYIDEGVFRQVYKICGCPIVVKFPLMDSPGGRDGIQHSISEVGRIRRLSKIRELAPHLPKVHYHDRKKGVLVVQYYPRPRDDAHTVELLGKVFQKLVARIARVKMADIHADNVRKRYRGDTASAVFTDLGY